MADDRPRLALTPEQEQGMDMCRAAITGETYSTKVRAESGAEFELYEVPCVISRLVIENGEVSATFRPVAPVWKHKA